MTKYDALTRYLSSQSYHRVPMTFSQIEEVLQTKLPRSADLYRAWWSNNPSNNVMTKAWLAAGFETEQVDLPERKLIFRRVGPIMDRGNGPEIGTRRPSRRFHGSAVTIVRGACRQTRAVWMDERHRYRCSRHRLDGPGRSGMGAR